MDIVDNPERIRYWFGSIDTSYRYTVGVAGERFLRELKENGRVTASHCDECGTKYLPPRLYCVECFSRVDRHVEVPEDGWYVHTFTTYEQDPQESSSDTQCLIVAKHRSVKGGIIHRLLQASPEEIRVGMPIRPLPKTQEERTGSILDLQGFVPSS